jgi:alkanesulfonate monooxygenase SsuD/methylene tetrahydromethanopterin reductase-like flavin-dependent oxidoreductase (luciferase family)
MRFGIYCEIQTPPGKSHYDQTWEIMRQIEHADESGFDVYSVIDHHFFQKFSISANPLAMFAAAAQRTKHIRFRTALHTLPLENPMRLAGMIAETDILTNGRLECGLGRGHAWLFGPSSLPLEESRPRYNEAVDILELAFTKDKFSYHGQYYNVDNVSVVPRPIQKPYPKFYTGGTSDITYQTAGEKGWGIFVPPLLPWKVLEGPLNIYKKACAEHGHESDIVYIRPVYIDDDESAIRREVERYLLNFLAFNASPVESIQSEEKKAELRAKGYGFYASGALESLTKLNYDHIVDQEIAFIGTPDKVIQQVKNLQAKGGIGELAIVSNFGGIEHWKSIKTQHMFSKHVMSAFQKKTSGAKAAD